MTPKNHHAGKTFYDAAIFSAHVETTGYMGGDAGHGGYATFTLRDDAQDETWEIHVKGDSEIKLLADALGWAGESLKGLL